MPRLQGRKRRAEPEPTENEYETPASSPEPAPQRRRTSPPSEADDDDAYGGDHAQDGQDQMVKKLVRLALACEYQRKPIRRTDISEKVLGTGGGRAFKEVFSRAQHQLRTVFGMEMVELPGREKATLQQKRAAQKSANSQAAKAPTTWILTTTLPSRFRDPAILPPPAAPTSAEDSTYTSLYTLLCSLILLSGGQLPDAKMERYLRRLGMEDTTPLVGTEYSKTEKFLKRLEKDGYILKVRESAGQGDEDVFWVLGPRGRTEVGEMGVKGLVKAVHGDLDEEEEEELERRIARSLGIGEGPPPSKQQNGEEGRKKKKKKGRPRRDAEEEEEGGDEEEEEDEDE